MKRFIFALAIAAGLAAGAYGAAAALNVTANNLQSGSDENLICDADGVQVYWQDGWQSSIDDFGITGVSVGGVSDSCDGLLLEVVLTDSAGNWMASGATTIGAADPTVVDTGDVAAKDVYDVHVIIR